MCAWYRIQTRIEFTLTHKQTNPLTHTPFIVCDGCICSKVRIVRKKRHVTQLHLQTPECIGMNKTQWKCSTTTLNTCKNAWIPTCRSVARSVSMRFTQNIHINKFFLCLLSCVCVSVRWELLGFVLWSSFGVNKFMQTLKLCSRIWTIDLFGCVLSFGEFFEKNIKISLFASFVKRSVSGDSYISSSYHN